LTKESQIKILFIVIYARRSSLKGRQSLIVNTIFASLVFKNGHKLKTHVPTVNRDLTPSKKRSLVKRTKTRIHRRM